MSAMGKRLGIALLFTAGVTILNVYIVLTGKADDLYDRIPGTAPQPVAQAPLQGCTNSHVAVFPDGTPIHSAKFLPSHLIKRS
jgi:hypothetical protein